MKIEFKTEESGLLFIFFRVFNIPSSLNHSLWRDFWSWFFNNMDIHFNYYKLSKTKNNIAIWIGKVITSKETAGTVNSVCTTLSVLL